MSRPVPNPERILDCARRLARELHGIKPPEAELSERVEYVLWGRKQAWTFLEDGIITEVELRNLLIDHLDYECAHVSGKAWEEFAEDRRQWFVGLIDRELFGRDAAL